MTSEPVKRQTIHIEEKKWDMLLEVLSKQRDMLQAGSEVQAAIDTFLNESLKPPQQADPSKLTYQIRQGGKGEYQRAFESDNPSEDFKILVETLKEHNGIITLAGGFYWLLDDGSIGRKPARK
jgi:hypothetical protein